MQLTEALLEDDGNNVEKITKGEKTFQISPKEGRQYSPNRLRLVGLGAVVRTAPQASTKS